jgi:hypothetical protein
MQINGNTIQDSSLNFDSPLWRLVPVRSKIHPVTFYDFRIGSIL